MEKELISVLPSNISTTMDIVREDTKQRELDKDIVDITEDGDKRRQLDYMNSRKMGERGEQEVEYALKWLVGDYIKIEKTASGKYGLPAIVLNNPQLIDEPQEFDHIVIGYQGVFNIETKNYSGKLIVDKNGNWIREKDGKQVGERNPLQQVRRHEAVLKSIVGDNVPVTSVLVMAHPTTIIEGVENCVIPLVKSDLLGEYITNYQSSRTLTADEMNEVRDLIEKYRVSKS